MAMPKTDQIEHTNIDEWQPGAVADRRCNIGPFALHIMEDPHTQGAWLARVTLRAVPDEGWPCTAPSEELAKQAAKGLLRAQLLDALATLDGQPSNHLERHLREWGPMTGR